MRQPYGPRKSDPLFRFDASLELESGGKSGKQNAAKSQPLTAASRRRQERELNDAAAHTRVAGDVVDKEKARGELRGSAAW